MLRQVTTNEALESYVYGKEVKILKPGAESGWGGMRPCTMDELLEGVICLVEEDSTETVEIAPVQEEDEEEQDEEQSDIEPLREQEAQQILEEGENMSQKKVDHGKIMSLYRAGWTPKKIADEMGCTAQTVRNHIAKG